MNHVLDRYALFFAEFRQPFPEVSALDEIAFRQALSNNCAGLGLGPSITGAHAHVVDATSSDDILSTPLPLSSARCKEPHEARCLTLAIFRETGDQRATGTALGNVAVLLYEMGDLDGAKAKYAESLSIKEKIGYQRGIAYDLAGLSNVLRAQGDLIAARQKGEDALAIRTRIGEKHNSAASALDLAQLNLEDGKAREAEEGARQALEELQTEKSEADEAMALIILSQALSAQQKVSQAQHAISQAEKLAHTNTSLPLQFEVVLASSRVALATPGKDSNRQIANNRNKAESALAQAQHCGYLEYQLRLRLLLGEIDLHSGNTLQGRVELGAVQHDASTRGFGLIARSANTVLSNPPGRNR